MTSVAKQVTEVRSSFSIGFYSWGLPHTDQITQNLRQEEMAHHIDVILRQNQEINRQLLQISKQLAQIEKNTATHNQ